MNYPPLKVWLITLLLFSVTFFVNGFFQDEIHRFFLDRRFEYVFSTQATTTDDVKVVILCSSLGHQAIGDVALLDDMMPVFDQAFDYEFVKLTVTGANLEDFTGSQLLMDQLVAYDPDILVIQESFLFFDRKEYLQSYSLRRTVTRILKNLFSNPQSSEKALLNRVTEEVYKDSLRYHSPFLSRRVEVRKQPSLNLFSEKLDAVIVVAEVPLPELYERAMDEKRGSDVYTSLFRAEYKLTSFHYLDFKEPLPFSYYYDESHMNDRGEWKYTNWLLQKLRSIPRPDDN